MAYLKSFFKEERPYLYSLTMFLKALLINSCFLHMQNAILTLRLSSISNFTQKLFSADLNCYALVYSVGARHLSRYVGCLT